MNCGGSDLQWTAIPSRKSKKLHATETRVSSSSHELVGSKASLFFQPRKKEGLHHTNFMCSFRTYPYSTPPVCSRDGIFLGDWGFYKTKNLKLKALLAFPGGG